MSKRHVSIEQKVCIVTGKPYDSGTVLLDRRLRKSMERNTITGWGISPEVQEKFDDDFVALVAIDETKSTEKNGRIKPEDAYRTGEIVYLRRPVFIDLFEDIGVKNFTFVDQQVLEFLKALPRNEE